MDAIEKRARELLAEGVRNAWPDDHGRRLVIDALLVDGLDFISARVAVKALAAALTPPEGYVLVSIDTLQDLASDAEQYVRSIEFREDRIEEKLASVREANNLLAARPEVKK